MEKVFIEENEMYQIDFSKTLWATNKLHDIFHKAKISLCDVDWIAETDSEILLVEYKNANIKNATNPTAFDPTSDKKINNMLNKYYDSMFYLCGIGKLNEKKKTYVCILEYPKADNVTNKIIRNKLKDKLPFVLQRNESFKFNMIDKVEVMTIKEWNKNYPSYPITEIEKEVE